MLLVVRTILPPLLRTPNTPTMIRLLMHTDDRHRPAFIPFEDNRAQQLATQPKQRFDWLRIVELRLTVGLFVGAGYLP